MTVMKRCRPGFTLFQLLLILAILLILLALFLPALVKVRMASLRRLGSNNLRQLGIATQNCCDTYGKMPPTLGAYPINGPNGGVGSLHFFLLPFMEQANLYNLSNDGNRFRASHEGTAAVVIKTFLAPNDPSAPPVPVYDGWLALCNYPANYLVFEKGDKRFPASIPDGTTNTMFFATRYQMCNGHPHAWGYDGWYYWAPMFAYYSTEVFQVLPPVKDCDPERAQSLLSDGMQAGMGDGSVHFVSSKVSAQTWLHACQPDDGFPLGEDW